MVNSILKNYIISPIRMKISALKEKASNEKRVAITPETAKIFVKAGYEVCIEKGAGLASNYTDQEYTEAGAKISSVPLEVISDADIIAKVQFSPEHETHTEKEFAKESALIIGLLNPYSNDSLIDFYTEKKINLLSLDLVPRTTKAQSFDALSSQANLVGYRAVIEASYQYLRAFPMLMTAAGTITPAKIFVLGAGVAGLQAIATARRLGASVFGYDVRTTAKEQVESLGAKFIHPDLSADFSNAGGYATSVDSEFGKRQEAMLLEEISKFDIVISTAMIPGKKAPILITKEMIGKMKHGSIIVDIAASSGGNSEWTRMNQIVEENGVKIIGYENFASKISNDASKLYAKNIANLVTYMFAKNTKIDINDETIKPMILTYNGKRIFGLTNA